MTKLWNTKARVDSSTLKPRDQEFWGYASMTDSENKTEIIMSKLVKFTDT